MPQYVTAFSCKFGIDYSTRIEKIFIICVLNIKLDRFSLLTLILVTLPETFTLATIAILCTWFSILLCTVLIGEGICQTVDVCCTFMFVNHPMTSPPSFQWVDVFSCAVLKWRQGLTLTFFNCLSSP